MGEGAAGDGGMITASVQRIHPVHHTREHMRFVMANCWANCWGVEQCTPAARREPSQATIGHSCFHSAPIDSLDGSQWRSYLWYGPARRLGGVGACSPFACVQARSGTSPYQPTVGADSWLSH